MLIGPVMSKPVVSCRLNENLEVVAQRMWDHSCDALPVVDEQDDVIAIVTGRDIVMSAMLSGKRIADIAIADAMANGAFVCSQARTASAAEALLQDCRVRFLPAITTVRRIAAVVTVDVEAVCGVSETL